MNSHQRRKVRRTIEREVERFKFIPVLLWIKKQVDRILARRMHNAVMAIVERCKVLALPAPKSNAAMLAKGVESRLGKSSGPAKSWQAYYHPEKSIVHQSYMATLREAGLK